MAECNLPKVDVEGSIPFSRSNTDVEAPPCGVKFDFTTPQRGPFSRSNTDVEAPPCGVNRAAGATGFDFTTPQRGPFSRSTLIERG